MEGWIGGITYLGSEHMAITSIWVYVAELLCAGAEGCF